MNLMEDRKSEELKDYPMALDAAEYSSEEISPVLGRLIWALNRMIEKSAKGKGKSKK